MKKIVSLILISSFMLFAQGNQKKSFEEFKIDFQKNIKIDNKNIEQEYKERKKNNGLAILYSLLLPGMGELYAGNYSSGKYFTIADGALWVGLAGVTIYSENQKDNYKAFLVSNGGATLEGKDSKYFADVGNYMSVYEYNHIMELDRSLSDVYNEESHYWRWASQDQRREYRSMWKSSETASNSTRFIVGALLLNRVASIINAIRLVNAHNKNLKKELGWEMSFNYSNSYLEPEKITMNFRTSF